MNERVLSIFLLIDKGRITGMKATAVEMAGESDEEKIMRLKENLLAHFNESKDFPAPTNFLGKALSYRQFEKMKERGADSKVFEHIFIEFDAPDEPLILVTPVVDGKFMEYEN